MIQGTGSNVGKSLLVAGLCRAARRRGYAVAPFKPQNMSNNAAVSSDGGEIGRAQALQARACGIPSLVHMNPVLLKPETDTGAQVVVQGRRWGSVRAGSYGQVKAGLLRQVLESFHHLAARHDLVIVEGAGSPAEINLRAGDIANMGFARAAGVPVVLAGDIDRGGIIAQIVGTQAVLAPKDAVQVAGFVVNRFRGDPALFEEGYRMIAARTGWRGFGVLPHFAEAWRLAAEDSLSMPAHQSGKGLNIVCLGFSRMANFDDLDPLAQEAGVHLTMLPAGRVVPGDTDLVILPGSKSTRGDLAFMRAQGWDLDLAAHVRRGGAVLGICGGYQMLGRVVRDPQGLEGAPGQSPGLGLLDVETEITGHKQLREVQGRHAASGVAFSGYEIHMGRTTGRDCCRPFAWVEGRDEGAQSANGRVMGSYLHGMFREDGFRAAFLAALGGSGTALQYDATIESTIDALAAHIEAHLDVDGLFALARG